MSEAPSSQLGALRFDPTLVAAPPRSRRSVPLSYRRIGALAALADFGLIILLGHLSSWACHYVQLDAFGGQKFFSFVSLSCAVGYVLAMQAQGLYQPAAIIGKSPPASSIVLTWIVVAFGMLAIAFLAKISSEISRSATLILFCAGAVVVPTSRQWECRLLKKLIARNGLSSRSRVVLFGDLASNGGQNAAAKLGRYGYTVVGRFGFNRGGGSGAAVKEDFTAALAAMMDFIRVERVDQVLLAFDLADQKWMTIALDALRATPLPVKMLFGDRLNELATFQIEDLGPTRAIKLQNGPLSDGQQLAKRCFDVVVALCGLVVLAPFFVVIMTAIKLESPGAAMFRQRRSGFNGRVFRIYKFRSMHVTEDGARVVQATRNDKRITRIGRFIRRTSVDELPQLINVLRGEMSIVGPRPHALSHDDEYSKVIATYALRHHMKPGITGWAQANGYRGETSSLHQMEARVRHDLWYIANWSMLVDLKAVALTIVKALYPSNVY